MYRTAPLAGLWAHQTAGFYHDGRFATFLDLVSHYDARFNVGLSSQEKNDLVEYVKGDLSPAETRKAREPRAFASLRAGSDGRPAIAKMCPRVRWAPVTPLC